jgi:hypothetical protein
LVRWRFFNIILVLVHLLLKVILVLFTLITVLISLKTVVVHRVEGASLRAVLFLRIAWWFEMLVTLLTEGNYKLRTKFSNKIRLMVGLL